jgi:hypothetical protein
MRNLVRRLLDERQIQKLEDVKEWGYDPTAKQRAATWPFDARQKKLTRGHKRPAHASNTAVLQAVEPPEGG